MSYKMTYSADWGREWHETCHECEKEHWHAVVPKFETWKPVWNWDVYEVPTVLLAEPRLRLNPFD